MEVPPWRLTLRSVGKEIGLFTFNAFAIAILYKYFHWRDLAASAIPLSVIGSALTIFLSFRNNTSYNRWWEARTLWGGLINYSRSFARQITTFVENPEPEVQDQVKELVYMQIAYVHALRCALRGKDALVEVRKFMGDDAAESMSDEVNIPAAILQRMGRHLRELRDEDRLTELRYMSLDTSLTELTNLQGGCERIKNTPVPRQYDYFPRLFVYAYNIVLPLGIVGGLEMLTPLVVTFVAFLFLALERIGAVIEAPFESTVNDVPMTAMTRTIEINLKQQLGEKEIPKPVTPIDGVLY